MRVSRRAVATTLALGLCLPVSFVALTDSDSADAGTRFTARSVSTFRALTDARGVTWQPRAGFTGSANTSRRLSQGDIKGTTNDPLYRVAALGVTGYHVKVPAPGTYRVTLHMADGWYSARGRRIFDVRAEGRMLFQGVDIAGAVGRGAAYTRTGSVAVADGSLDLDFIARRDRTLINAVEVERVAPPGAGVVPTPPTTPAPRPTTTRPTPVNASPGQRAVRFSPDSFWTSDVRTAPLAPNSAAAATRLHRQIHGRYYGAAGFNSHDHNASFYRVPAGTRRVNLGYDNCQGKPWLAKYVQGEGKPFNGVPVPSDAVGAQGSDRAVTFYDPATDQLWEFWKFRKSNGRWTACWGGRIDQVSKNRGHFSGTFGATATGLVMAGGMITMEDIKRGEINHAMYLAIPEPASYKKFSWPALRSDGSSSDPNAIMEGQRLRLDPSIDVDSLKLSPVGRMVAKAAQKYGFIVADTAATAVVITESGHSVEKRTGTNPWDSILDRPSHQILAGIPWDRMQVIEKDYGKP